MITKNNILYIYMNIVYILLLILFFNLIRKTEFFKFEKYSLIQNNIKEDITNKYDILNEKWQNYRLGDVVKGFFFYTNDKKYLENLKILYPDSIGCDFYQKTNGAPNNEILFNIIQTRSQYVNKTNCVLHLRLGDVVNDGDNPDELPLRWQNQSSKGNYNYDYYTYEKLINYIKKNYNVDELTLIAGAHRDLNLDNSLTFLNKIKNLLISNGIKVNIRIGNNPDDDFLIMCNANIFCRAGGGFSNIISNYVNNNNGIVIDPKRI
tara:strand:+ start:228 stop:1019 length:792 start_codon:yes stop_codon:yes gene_type:complete